jgi:exonuclease SbcC
MRFRNQVDLEFPENQIVLITGENGSGKTSLLDSICIALYGRTFRTSGRADSGYLKINDLINHGSDRSLIRVEFENHGRKYVVTRKISRSASSGEIWEDGVQKAMGEKVYDYVSKYAIGLDWEGFRKSSIILQGEMSSLTAMLPTERRKALAKLFGLESYTFYEEISKTKAQEKESRLKVIEESEKLLSSEVKKVTSTKEDLAAIENRLQTLSPMMKETELELSRAKEIAEKLEEDYQKYRLSEQSFREKQELLVNLRTQVFEIDQEVSKIEALKIAFPNIERSYKEFKELELKKKELDAQKRLHDEKVVKIETLRASLSAKEGEVERFRGEARILEEDIKKLESEIPPQSELDLIVSRLEDERNSFERTTKELASLNAQMESNRKIAQDLALNLEQITGRAECPVCLQPITDRSLIVEHYNREISKCEKNSLQLTEDRKVANERLELLSNNIRNLENRQRKIQEKLAQSTVVLGYKKKLEELQKRMNTSIKEFSLLLEEFEVIKRDLEDEKFDQKMYETVSKNYGEYASQNIVEQYTEVRMRISQENSLLAKRRRIQEDLSSQEKEAELARATAERLRGSMLEFQEISDRLGRLSETYQDLTKQSLSLEKERELVAEKLKELVEKENLLERYWVERKRLESDIEVLKILRRIFREIPDRIIRRLRPYLERESIDIITELSEGQISTISIDDSSLSISAGSDGKLKQIHYFSGGEKTRINMALRIAISRILSKLPDSAEHRFATMQTLFIDEGDFGNLDENGIADAARVLKRLSQEFDRVILISHVEELKHLLQGLAIEVLKTENEESIAKPLTRALPNHDAGPSDAVSYEEQQAEDYSNQLRPFEPS